MDYLSRLFKLASMQKEFTFHPHCKKLGLTHLIFADDLIRFCKAHPQSLQILMKAFHRFTQCLGLKANMEKSNIVFGGGFTDPSGMFGHHWICRGQFSF